MSYLDRIQECNQYSLEHYLDFYIASQQYGWAHKNFAQHLEEWPEVFQVSNNTISLKHSLDCYQSRSVAVEPVLKELHERGVIDSWVGENYPVTHRFEDKGEMELERSATLYLGLNSFGIHVNGLVKKNNDMYIWVGIRAKDKPFFPGKLDQIVAGGQPVGIGLMENVVKESKEEANIPAELAQQSEFVGTVSYCQEGRRGIDQSTIYNYDLWLPEDFIPENTDGEVDSFELISLHEMADITANTNDFKDNCNLVNIDLLLRLGYINKTHPDYTKIQQSLYQRQS